MKKLIVLISFLFILHCHTGLAADGDLIVNGNIGVGTTSPVTNLEVNGGIKAGNVTAACTSALAGTMRWNATSAIYEYCNGTAWTAMGGANKTWQMIWSADVTTAATSVSTGNILNGDVDAEYKIISKIVNSSVSGPDFYVRPNGDSGSNYTGTGFQSWNSALYYFSASGKPTGFWCGTTNDFSGTYDGYCEISLNAASGHSRLAVINSASDVSVSSIGTTLFYHAIWKNTSSNITSIVFSSSATNGIGIGSHFEIWTKR